MKKQQFNESMNWYKANFHAHSTDSDGLLSPSELVRQYQKMGYSILMLSEHELYQDTTEFDTSNFLLYPGIERSIILPDQETYHIQGIADYTQLCKRYCHHEYIPVPSYESMEDVQHIIDEIKGHGNFVMINHPNWSFNTFSHLDYLHNFDFIEIYNHNCHVETDLGNSENYYDHLLQSKNLGVLATDDNHNSHRYESGIHMWDSFGGFTMIQADTLTRESISKALKNGRFYASTGPKIHQFQIEGNQVNVTCSEVEHIVFKAWPRRGYRLTMQEQPLTKGTYTLRGGEQWIRVKCIDKAGNAAWSNPLYLDK